MAQVSYGTITISDITDISDIYYEYCLASIDADAEDVSNLDYFYNYQLTQDIKGYTDEYNLTEDTTVIEGKTYYIQEGTEDNYTYIKIDNPIGNPKQQEYYELGKAYNKNYYSQSGEEESYVYTIVTDEAILENPSDNNLYERIQKDINEIPWTITYPKWIPEYQIWRRDVTIKEGINEAIYEDPSIDMTMNQVTEIIQDQQIEIEALQSNFEHRWENPVEERYYPRGIYSASGIDGTTFAANDFQTYGYNSILRHSAIFFNYNEIPLTIVGQEGINLYYPIKRFKQSQDTAIDLDKYYYDNNNNFISNPSGNPSQVPYYERIDVKGLELTAEGLSLYNPSVENDVAVELTTNGLIIKDGSIILGNSVESTSDGSVALTNQIFKRNINSILRDNLQFAIGSSFGVDKAGHLYASDAVISGNIQVTSSDSNVYNKDDTIAKINEKAVLQSDKYWQSLSSQIEIITEGTPQINIAAAPKEKEQDSFNSYLHLTGTEIDFIVNNEVGALKVEPDQITTQNVRARSIFMGLDSSEPTLGWVLRSNGHLSLKIMS